jgi:NADPH-dependent ferric siderophore reductase
MPAPFQASANALFHTEVRRVVRLSPGFLRVTLTGARLNQFATHGLDQRIKILVPTSPIPAVLDDELLHESEWRRRWRDLSPSDRPALRSYTTSAVRPDLREIDLDFYVHARPGPASSWAVTARAGQRLLVSGPHSRLSTRPHGIQWSPGAATQVLLAGDETAYPAIRGILAALPPSIRSTVVLEVGDPANADWLTREFPERPMTVHVRDPSHDRSALLSAVADWTRGAGAPAAGLGAAFYAWLATESGRVAQLRDLLHRVGIAPAQVHSQGYWNERPRGGPRA